MMFRNVDDAIAYIVQQLGPGADEQDARTVWLNLRTAGKVYYEDADSSGFVITCKNLEDYL